MFETVVHTETVTYYRMSSMGRSQPAMYRTVSNGRAKDTTATATAAAAAAATATAIFGSKAAGRERTAARAKNMLLPEQNNNKKIAKEDLDTYLQQRPLLLVCSRRLCSEAQHATHPR